MIVALPRLDAINTLGLSWYGRLPPPTGQFAWSRQFDAGLYLSNLFFPNAQPPENPLTPRYVELNALSILKDQLTPAATEPQSTEDALTKLISGRLWPTNWPPASGANALPVQTLNDGSALLGQILNILA